MRALIGRALLWFIDGARAAEADPRGAVVSSERITVVINTAGVSLRGELLGTTTFGALGLKSAPGGDAAP